MFKIILLIANYDINIWWLLVFELQTYKKHNNDFVES